MKIHHDHIHTLFDGERKGVPILTILGLLNDDFEGGDFLMFDGKKLNLSAGDIVIFPSNFMYPHAVTTVTKGTRYSFVAWGW
jgi:predicted 2-oxoglutarate/Fe(II)-dependent dioxygenase YbiX